MVIFLQTNKIKCKHADYLCNHQPLKNHVKRIERRPYTQFHATATCFKSTLYLLLWPTEKLLFASLFKMIFPFVFCRDDLRAAMLLAPGHNFAAPEPSITCMLQETATFFLPPRFWVVTWSATTREERPQEQGWELRNMARKLSTDRRLETLCQIIIRRKSVLYCRSSGKVKNKWPVGGRVIIVAWNVWNS